MNRRVSAAFSLHKDSHFKMTKTDITGKFCFHDILNQRNEL